MARKKPTHDESLHAIGMTEDEFRLECLRRYEAAGYPLAFGVPPPKYLALHISCRVAYEGCCRTRGEVAEEWDWPPQETMDRLYGRKDAKS